MSCGAEGCQQPWVIRVEWPDGPEFVCKPHSVRLSNGHYPLSAWDGWGDEKIRHEFAEWRRDPEATVWAHLDEEEIRSEVGGRLEPDA